MASIEYSPTAIKTERRTELALLALRITTGLFLMPHGAQKLFGAFGGDGIQGTAAFLAESGYVAPTFFAVAIGTLEFFGGLALAAGFLTRFVSLCVVAFMLGALQFHFPNGYFWFNGGFEYPIFWAVAAGVFLVIGGGQFSVDAHLPRFLGSK